MDKQLSELRREAIDDPSLLPLYCRKLCHKYGHHLFEEYALWEKDPIQVCLRCGVSDWRFSYGLPLWLYEYDGKPLTWQIPSGKVHYLESLGLSSISSTLVTRCGVRSDNIHAVIEERKVGLFLDRLKLPVSCRRCLRIGPPESNWNLENLMEVMYYWKETGE